MPEKENSTPPPRRGLFRNWLSLAGAVIATGQRIFLPVPVRHRIVSAPQQSLHGDSGLYPGARLFLSRRRADDCRFVDATPAETQRLVVGGQSDPGRATGNCWACSSPGRWCFCWRSAIGSYQTYQYTDSVQFCGTACHVPMKPEYTTYLQSPHARVACVECHVGPGADWYVRSKLNGVHQLFDVVLNTVPRPIETPLGNLRPARETCEQCHWPQRFIGDIDRTDYHYLSDETNTPFAVRLELKVGGGRARRLHERHSLARQPELQG